MIQLAAMVRAFKIAENRERGSDAFRCDGGQSFIFLPGIKLMVLL